MVSFRLDGWYLPRLRETIQIFAVDLVAERWGPIEAAPSSRLGTGLDSTGPLKSDRTIHKAYDIHSALSEGQ